MPTSTITVTLSEETAPLLDENHLSADTRNNIVRRRTCDGTHFDAALSPFLTLSATDTTTTSTDTTPQTTTGASSAAGGDVSAHRRQASDSNLHDLSSMKQRKHSKLTETRNVHLAPITLRHAFSDTTASGHPIAELAYTETPITHFMREVQDSQKASVASAPDYSALFESPCFTQHSEPNDTQLDVLDIRIFFPEGRCVQFSVEGGAVAEVSDLIALMAEHLDLDEDDVSDVFAIWFISPLLEVQLKPHHVAAQIRMQWPAFLRKFTDADEADVLLDNPLLVLRRNVSLSIEREKELAKKSPKIFDLLYRDAKIGYLDGRYVVDVETALDLAALQLAADYEPYQNDEQAHELILTNLAELVPEQHYSKIRAFHLFGLHMMECKQGMEAALKQAYMDCSAKLQSEELLRTEFLNILRQTPFYGAAFFRGTVDRKLGAPTILELGRRLFTGNHPLSQLSVRVGIQQEFVTVVDEHKNTVLLTLRNDECTWIKEETELFLHFLDPKAASTLSMNGGIPAAGPVSITSMSSLLLRVFSRQAPMMADLLDGLSDLAASQYSLAHGGAVGSAASTSPVATPNVLSECSDGNLTDSSTASSVAPASSHVSRFSRESGERTPPLVSENKLSKLCLAMFDPEGRCVEAHGSIKRILMVH